MTTQPVNHYSDFTALYMKCRNLFSEVKKSPESSFAETIGTIQNILHNRPHADKKNAPLLFKTAAETLTEIILRSQEINDRQKALGVLQQFVMQNLGDPCLAAAQALGCLPLKLPYPSITPNLTPRSTELSWEALMSLSPISPHKRQWAGRSLILSSPDSNQVMVLKFSRTPQEEILLSREVAWMEMLDHQQSTFDLRCEIPEPLQLDNTCLFSINSPGFLQKNQEYQAKAIAYVVDKDYFVYPCQSQSQTCNFESFQEIMSRSSFLLGQFTSRGIIHSAPIPLFHNQTQQNRRNDNGLYLWLRKGRLDSWLSSCLYPNFGLSGLRDFEHLTTPDPSPRHLFQDIGTHILSLFLVAGSFFRLREPKQIGLNKDGTPKDMRHLFEPQALKELLENIFQNYYYGFVGQPFSSTMPAQIKFVVERMIEEMGVDRYMTEVFRVRDQLEMTEEQFIDFLVKKGLNQKEAYSMPKGVQEINLYTGPHLGQFNRQISLPEIIDFTASAAAVCIAAKHMAQRNISIFHLWAN